MKKLGIIGTPDCSVLNGYAGREFIDLDIGSGASLSLAERHLPKTFCAILKTVLSNALFYHDEIELIIAETGEAKCDGARMLCRVIEREIGIPVIETRQGSSNARISLPAPTPISDSDLPLTEKLASIMDAYVAGGLKLSDRQSVSNYNVLSPEDFTVGFWGVPPSDFDLLKLFPRATMVLGWTRAVEARVPESLEYEMHVSEGLPTVFFAQSFCQKGSLARYLANKYNGLYVDIDERMSASTRAKLDAFLQLAAGVKP